MKYHTSKFLSIAYFVSILFCLIFFSLMPESNDLSLPVVYQNWNIFHIPAYVMLTTAIFLMMSGLTLGLMKIVGLSALFSTMIGALIEALQQFKGRTMSWDDFLLNEIGVLAGSVIILIWIFLRPALRLRVK